LPDAGGRTNLGGVPRPSPRSLAIALTLAASALLAPPAHAASKIGDSYPLTNYCATSNPAPVDIQTSSTLNTYEAPYDGVITSWRNEGAWETLTFKVARLGAGSSYTVIGSDGPRSMTGSTPESFPVRISVRQGDVIGARRGSGNFECSSPGTPADSIGMDNETDVPVGGTGFFEQTVSNATVPVEAYIERDRDGDGYGDETQDACPTNASTQGPCPLPTTLGQTFSPNPSTSCDGYTWVVTSSPGVVHAAPSDGVITSWSHQAGSTVGGTLKLKVLRPTGGNSYAAIGEDGPRAPAAGVLNTWPTRVPVRQGDKIGLVGIGALPCRSGVVDWSLRAVGGDLAVGSAATFDGSSDRMLDLSAVLEADADGDGYGDTTQDLCPTDPTTQGQCRTAEPPTPPSGDDACEKARKKLQKAKKKLKKLKESDAKAKKIKSAKKGAKKAKKAVRKAC
jgi:hypothetical protein